MKGLLYFLTKKSVRQFLNSNYSLHLVDQLAINSESFLKYIQHVYTLSDVTPEHQIL